MRRDLLEGELLGALAGNLTRQSLRKFIQDEFSLQLMSAWNARIRDTRNSASSHALKGKREHLRHQGENVLNAIADGLGSALVYDRLKSIESQIRTLDELISTRPPKADEVPDIRTLSRYLFDQLPDLKSLLLSDPERAKQHISKSIQTLVLRPVVKDGKSLIEIDGQYPSIFSKARNLAAVIGAGKKKASPGKRQLLFSAA